MGKDRVTSRQFMLHEKLSVFPRAKGGCVKKIKKKKKVT